MAGRYKRGMVFGAFLGASLAVALVGASLATDYWIVSSAIRMPHGIPRQDSDGKIHFGLFHGVKELNVGYGWRTDDFSMKELIRGESGLLEYWAWVSVIGSVCAALALTACSALFSLINAAATPAMAPLSCLPVLDSLSSIPGLFFWNSLSIVFEGYAIGLWTWQYYKNLRHNIMSQEDRQLAWTSEGLAYLGHSYWLVIGALLLHIINIILIYSGTSEVRQKKSTQPVLEEKPNGNIMLY